MPLRLLTNLALLIGSAGAFMVATPSPARTAAAAAVSSTPVAPSMARVPRARPFMQDAAEDLEEVEEEVVMAEEEVVAEPEPETSITAPPGWQPVQEELWSPEQVADIRIEGGSTLKTFKMPAHAERVQRNGGLLSGPGGCLRGRGECRLDCVLPEPGHVVVEVHRGRAPRRAWRRREAKVRESE